MREIDITGRRFGRLTALYRDGWSNSWQSMWVCRCDCGNITRVERGNLVRGRTRSCGCLKHDFNNWRHGKAPVGQPEQD